MLQPPSITVRLGAALLLATLPLAACTRSHEPVAVTPAIDQRDVVPAARHASTPLAPVYDGLVTIDPARGHLTAQWEISFVPTAEQRDSVVLLLNRTLAISSLTGTAVAEHEVRAARHWQEVVVRFAPTLPAGAPAMLRLAYAGVPAFGSDSINGIRPDWVELGLDSFWQPVFAGFEHMLRARVRLALPVGWTVVTSGVPRPGAGAETTITFENDLPLPDVPFSASPALQRAAGSAPGSAVFHTGADADVVARIRDEQSACTTYLDERFGAREPLPPTRVVLAPRTGPGYSRQNYIVVTEAAAMPREEFAKFLCHELAHFWSRGAVSSGPENWLNEGFAEFVAGRFVRERYGAAAYDEVVRLWRSGGEGQPPVWTRAGTSRPGPGSAYRKAPLLLTELEARIGQAAMARLLERYMTERFATTPQLLAAIAEEAGAAEATWLEDALGR